MDKRTTIKVIIGLILFGVGFYSGYVLKSFLYNDQCLDLGGGINPGSNDICVIEG